MIRPWQIFAVYLVAVSVAFAAMFAVTQKSLQLDRDEQLGRLRAELEERIGGALWTMDAEMSPLLAAELSRPWGDFSEPPSGQGKRVKGPKGFVGAVDASPIRPKPTGEELVRLRFRVNIDNDWRSPQCPQLPPEHVDDNRERARAFARLGRIRATVDFKQLASALPLPPDVRDRLSLPDETQTAQQMANNPPENQFSQQFGFNQFENQQAQQQVQQPAQQSGALDRTGAEQSRVFANNLARRNLLVQRREAVNSVLNSERPEEERWSNILWIGDELVLARLATIDGSASILGSCLNWDRVQARLRDRVRETLPEFDLTPITSEQELLKHRALATLPLRLDAPPVTLDFASGWTPIQMTLALAWLFLSLAAIAVGALLVGAIRLSERRAEFVSAVTHELRSPLTTFQLYTEMLIGGMVEPDARDTYLRTLKAESERLAHLVENVLQYSRLERGKRPNSDQSLKVTALVERMAPRLDERLRQAGMQLQVEYGEQAKSACVSTDPSAIEQILFNLADNASKYAADGEPKRLDVAFSVEAGRVVCLVRDWGPGVPASGKRTLFQPFSKSVDQAAESAPGVGLGLALCRRLACQLGGSLRLLENPEGNGAIFRLDIGKVS
jgi:signal transduction histidine kinase